MASLRKRRGNWYGRIRWSSNGKRYEKNIPFHTQSKSTAVERLMEIRKVESYIREGMEFSFPWKREFHPFPNVAFYFTNLH